MERQSVARRAFAGPGGFTARRLLSAVVVGCLLAVTGHHLWLLWSRLTSGQLLDPDIGLRWAAGLPLILALAALRRCGVPLLWGRKALAYWLVVLLFHGVATGPVPEPGVDYAQADAQALFVWPVSVAPLVLAVAALWGLASGRRLVLARASRGQRRQVPPASVLSGPLFQLAPRAPPA